MPAADVLGAPRAHRFEVVVESLEQRALLSASSSVAAATAAGLLVAQPSSSASAAAPLSVTPTVHAAVRRSTRSIRRARTPAAPSDLSATSYSSVRTLLSWTNNAANASTYSVERNSGRRGRFVVIATLGPAASGYLDRHGLPPGTY
jgi:hypothetical protein